MVKVSVILVSWNSSDFILDALRSIEDQTFQDFELICIDNGSEDGTQVLIEAFLSNSKIASLMIFNGENLGICRALNQGLEISSGDFIVQFAADDVMLPDRLEVQIEEFHHLPQNVALLCGDALVIDKEGRPKLDAHGQNQRMKSVVGTTRSDSRRELLWGRVPLTPTVMMRRTSIDRVGDFDIESRLEDYDYWLRLVFSGEFTFAKIDRDLSLYRWHGTNHSDNTLMMQRSVDLALAKLAKESLTFREHRILRKRRRHLAWSIAWIELGEGLITSTYEVRRRTLLVIFARNRHFKRRLYSFWILVSTFIRRRSTNAK